MTPLTEEQMLADARLEHDIIDNLRNLKRVGNNFQKERMLRFLIENLISELLDPQKKKDYQKEVDSLHGIAKGKLLREIDNIKEKKKIYVDKIIAAPGHNAEPLWEKQINELDKQLEPLEEELALLDFETEMKELDTSIDTDLDKLHSLVLKRNTLHENLFLQCLLHDIPASQDSDILLLERLLIDKKESLSQQTYDSFEDGKTLRELNIFIEENNIPSNIKEQIAKKKQRILDREQEFTAGYEELDKPKNKAQEERSENIRGFIQIKPRQQQWTPQQQQWAQHQQWQQQRAQQWTPQQLAQYQQQQWAQWQQHQQQRAQQWTPQQLAQYQQQQEMMDQPPLPRHEPCLGINNDSLYPANAFIQDTDSDILKLPRKYYYDLPNEMSFSCR